jgi:hypothetical protein
MQDRPTARELLATLSTFFDEELLPSLTGPLQYRVRVAANLVKILERELELGPAHDRDERAALAALVDCDANDDLIAINTRLGEAIEAGRFDRQPEPLWRALMAITRAKLAVVKPPYDAYDGSIEQP